MSFWKPAGVAAAQIDVDEHDAGQENTTTFMISSITASSQLPIAAHRKQILYALTKYEVLVIVGETGSGKSTQIPQYLLEGGWCKNDYRVVCTQPRRLAAITLAQRVADEQSQRTTTISRHPPSQSMQTHFNKNTTATVGHIVRFDSNYSPSDTKILYVTDGILIREALTSDPLLLQYSVVMVDEAHERSIMTDVLLGILLKIRRKRPSLRIIVCSATIDAEAFLKFLCPTDTDGDGGACTRNTDSKNTTTTPIQSYQKGCIISVDGRQYPMDVYYMLKPPSDYLVACVDTALSLHETESNASGDILCFLPTGEDIDSAIRLAEERLAQEAAATRTTPMMSRGAGGSNKKQKRSNSDNNVICLPLYGTLPQHLQSRIFDQPQKQHRYSPRRIIFATNIAETSVTVPNVRYVIDSGFVKMPYYDAENGLERLVVAPISQASAKQRAGRAGRISPGKCYRLYTYQTYQAVLEEATPPEILRTNLTSFVLTLKALGIDNLATFRLMSRPSSEALSHALETLYALGAIDESCELTRTGEKLCIFPTSDPRIGKMLLASLDDNLRCTEEMLYVAAALQVRNLFLRPKTAQQRMDYDGFMGEIVDRSGDHVTYAQMFLDRSDMLHQGAADRDSSCFINKLALQRAKEIRNQLKRFLWANDYGTISKFEGSDGESGRSIAIRKCVTAGFFLNVAKISSDGKYYTIKGHQRIQPSSTSSIFSRFGEYSDYIVFGETYDSETEGCLEVRHVSAISGLWLKELAPHYWT
mmetsp:Transcript_22995/g.35461  ORF Transcript_22995/g.35461 Transcript_22995/m.35461 type:complete len:759 (-) Transcript_22995:340-2616(-)